MKYYIGFSLSEEARQQAQLMAQDLESTFGIKNPFDNYPPHITLKLPFTRYADDKELLLDFLKKFVHGRKPIPVELKRFGHFNVGVIFWDVLQDDEALTLLQQELCDALEVTFPWIVFDPIEPNGQPHVTVGKEGIKGRFKFIHEYLHDKYPQGMHTVLTNLELFQKSPHTNKWEIAETVILQ